MIQTTNVGIRFVYTCDHQTADAAVSDLYPCGQGCHKDIGHPTVLPQDFQKVFHLLGEQLVNDTPNMPLIRFLFDHLRKDMTNMP